MGFIEDINRGTMDRLLVSPIWRGALNLGSVAQSVLSLVIQSLIVIGLALAVGAHFHNGIEGVAVLIAVAGLLGAVFASLSNGIAVLTRQRETLIGIVTMATLPLTFLSTALMQQSLLPGWIRWVAKFNPVNWAAEAGRSAAGPDTDWGLIATRTCFSRCSCWPAPPSPPAPSTPTNVPPNHTTRGEPHGRRSPQLACRIHLHRRDHCRRPCRRRPHLVDLPNRTNRDRTRQPQTEVERKKPRDPTRGLTGMPTDFPAGH